MKTSIAMPPPPTGVAYWERSSDPFHPDAFAGIKEVAHCFPRKQKATPRADGWMGIDYIGNPIAFVTDGTEVEDYPHEYRLREGYPGRLCAVPENSIKDFEQEVSNREAAKAKSQQR